MAPVAGELFLPASLPRRLELARRRYFFTIFALKLDNFANGVKLLNMNTMFIALAGIAGNQDNNAPQMFYN